MNMIAKLVNGHPALFRGRIPPRSDLPEGWYTMMDDLCVALETSLSHRQLSAFHIRQITGESGALRIYRAGIPIPLAEHLISAVQDLSVLVCQDCGCPGRLRAGKHPATLCDFCEEERDIRAKRVEQSRSSE